MEITKTDFLAICDKVAHKFSSLSSSPKMHGKINFQIIQSIVHSSKIKALPLRMDTFKWEVKDFDFQKPIKNPDLDLALLYGQFLFYQCASTYFLDKLVRHYPQYANNKNYLAMKSLSTVTAIHNSFSTKCALSERGRFSSHFMVLKKQMEQECPQAIPLFMRAKGFYNQLNDLNYLYSSRPSYFFSNFIKKLESIGGAIALAATFTTIIATILSFVPPCAPIAVPVALISSYIALGFGLPLAVKKIGNTVFNGVVYGVAPTQAEIINIALFGVSLLTMGTLTSIGVGINAGLFGKGALATSSTIKALNTLTKSFFSSVGILSNKKLQQHQEDFAIDSSPMVLK